MGEHTLNPIVGETNDSRVNNMWADPIQKEEVFAALNSASAGLVEEGSVGAGTGTGGLANGLEVFITLTGTLTPAPPPCCESV